MEEITLDKLSTADLETLQTIGYNTFYEAFARENKEENIRSYMAEAFSEKKLAAELAQEQSAFYFAKLHHETVGYIKVNYGPAQTDLKEDRGMELERIYVLRQYQGRKIGKQLLLRVIEMAQQQRKEYVWLGVWEKNQRAIRFYEDNGFRIFSSHPFLMGTEMQTDYLMKIEL